MMDIEVKKQNKMPLLSRERVTGYVHFDGVTPSLVEVRKALAHKIKATEDNVVVRHLYGRYGMRRAKMIAHIYHDQAVLKHLEGTNLLKKNGFAVEAAKPAEAPAEAK
ncbi:hypothetical protein HZA99_05900 [Candidatus Woesearchaeota archaeon]|nr:hypothetical protein [Candidatus Woesearchaeota archaeon]